METKRIETYSLFEFCDKIQEAILEGWRFDFESNENAPVAFGSMLVAGMVKAEPKQQEVVAEANTEEVAQVQPKRGRPSKE